MKRRAPRVSWMTQRQDAINKRMRGQIRLQRQKRLWQKRRSPINGIGLFAALPIRAGTPIIEFKGRVIPWEEGAVMLLRGANHVIKFDAKHDMDARPQWSPAGHVNHGCYPNCAIKKKRGGLWLTSIRRIEQHDHPLYIWRLESISFLHNFSSLSSLRCLPRILERPSAGKRQCRHYLPVFNSSREIPPTLPRLSRWPLQKHAARAGARALASGAPGLGRPEPLGPRALAGALALALALTLVL